MTALTSGRLKVDGDIGLLTKSTRFFKKYTPPSMAGAEEEKREELLEAAKEEKIFQKLKERQRMKYLKVLDSAVQKCSSAFIRIGFEGKRFDQQVFEKQFVLRQQLVEKYPEDKRFHFDLGQSFGGKSGR